MRVNSKKEKIKKILGKEGTCVVICDDFCLLNGNALKILISIQKALIKMADSGVPKEIIRDFIELAYMSQEELDRKFEEEVKRFNNSIEELLKGLEKPTKKGRKHETSNK